MHKRPVLSAHITIMMTVSLVNYINMCMVYIVLEYLNYLGSQGQQDCNWLATKLCDQLTYNYQYTRVSHIHFYMCFKVCC